MSVIREKIPEPLAGERLDRVVAMITSCSRAQAVALIEACAVSISGKAISSKSYKVRPGQRISIDDELLRMTVEQLGDDSVKFAVVFEDADVVVIDKPSGLVVHPGTGADTGTLVNGLLARYPEISAVGQAGRPGVVHRLDRGTSGLMVVARSQRAYSALVEMLAKHEINRTYTALIHGELKSSRGVIDSPIGRSLTNATHMAISPAGKVAVTRYEVKRHYAVPVVATLVEVNLETGRTHQIRVHMKAIGHPLIGDDLYSRRRVAGIERIFLHSSEIRFAHPVTGEEISAFSELPRELSEFLEKLT